MAEFEMDISDQAVVGFMNAIEKSFEMNAPFTGMTVKECIWKQVPMKPEEKYPYFDKGIHYFDAGMCPSCGRIAFSKNKYCYECGQRLDWEE